MFSLRGGQSPTCNRNVITRLVIQLGRPHEAGDDQLALVRFSSRFFRVPALAAGSRTCACVSCGNGSGTRAFSATGFRLRDF